MQTDQALFPALKNLFLLKWSCSIPAGIRISLWCGLASVVKTVYIIVVFHGVELLEICLVFVILTEKRGQSIKFNDEAVTKYRAQRVGVFVLISNFEKDTVRALETYRNKDVVEKCFDDLKSGEDCNRLRMHSDHLVQVKILLCFLALILHSELANRIRDNQELTELGIPCILQEMNTIREVAVEHRYRRAITERTGIQQMIWMLWGFRSNSLQFCGI